MTLKRCFWAEISSSKVIPLTGEIVLCIDSPHKMKIGDGKTLLKDLPWIDMQISVDPALSVSDKVKQFIEDNIELIEQNRFNELFDKVPHLYMAKELVDILKRADVNLRDHLFPTLEYLKGYI